MKVDNFALSQFDCPAKYKLRIVDHIVPLRRKPSLSFGGVLHEGLAEWYRTGDKIKALKMIVDRWPDVMPSDDFRTKEYAVRVMAEYLTRYPSETWKVLQGPSGPIVEQAFTLDTGLDMGCELSDPGKNPHPDLCPKCGKHHEMILYGGIIDVGAEFGDMFYVVDHKTTTVLGKEDSSYYFQQFKPDGQMTGYIWALGKLTNRRVGGALINAIGLYKSDEVRFKRQITNRNQFELDEWLVGVQQRCLDIRRAERSGIWRLNTNQCSVYGQCEYHSIHVLGDETARAKRIEQDYVVSEWNYESRD